MWGLMSQDIIRKAYMKYRPISASLVTVHKHHKRDLGSSCFVLFKMAAGFSSSTLLTRITLTYEDHSVKGKVSKSFQYNYIALKACTNVRQICRLEVVPPKMFPSGTLYRFKWSQVLKTKCFKVKSEHQKLFSAESKTCKTLFWKQWCLTCMSGLHVSWTVLVMYSLRERQRESGGTK